MTKRDFLLSTAEIGSTFPSWQYIDRETGEKLGEPMSYAQAARDMVLAAKMRMAEEKSRRPKQPETEFDGEAAREEFNQWLRRPIFLDKPQHSIAHKIVAAELGAHILLIQHDWAELLDKSKISGTEADEVHLPYPVTVFEFAFQGGVRFVSVMTEMANGHAGYVEFVKVKSGWLKISLPVDPTPKNELDIKVLALFELIRRNIRAICIMLEAEVAESTPSREEYKRNRERPESAPLPQYSYHVVSLAQRTRCAPSGFPTEDRRRPRLHFRRGHWRHYSSHRTWIKWQLVGNPELGFIEKEYRL